MEKTRFPDKNFDTVIAAEVKKAPTDTLIIQAGSIDITNMKTTGNNVKRFSEYFKQQTIISAKNLFSGVSNIIVNNPGIKQTIIMKHIPRYDLSSKDPLSIKAALSQLYNNTITQLWLDSPHKEKIQLVRTAWIVMKG